MSMDVEPDSVRVPKSWAMIGVMGVKVAVTRTETMLPGAVKLQTLPVQLPVGVAVPFWTQLISAVATLPKGAIIRLAAVLMSARRAVSLAGQTGPPTAPHAG